MENISTNDENIYESLKGASDSESIITKLRIGSIDQLSESQTFNLLFYSIEQKNVAEIIGHEKIRKLKADSIYLLLKNSKDTRQTANILGNENINKLSGQAIFSLLYDSHNPEALNKIVDNNNILKLSEENLSDLLFSGCSSIEIANIILSVADINFSDKIIHSLIAIASDKEKASNLLLSKKGNDLSDDDLFYLLQYSPDVELIKQDVIQENIYKLSGGNFARLYSGSFSHRFKELLDSVGDGIVLKIPDYGLRCLIETAFRVNKDVENVINFVFKHENGDLPEDCVCLLLLKASDLDAMAERIGRNNIAKLTEKNVVELLSLIDDSDKIASILGADNMNKLSYDSVFQLFCTYSDKKRKKLTNAILSHTEFPEAAFVFYQLFKGSNNRKLKKMLLSKYKKLYIWKAWWNGWRVWGPLIGLSVLLLIPLIGIEEYTWHSYFISLGIWVGICVFILVFSILRGD